MSTSREKRQTPGDGNCFFHAAFGTNINGTYTAKKISKMRKEWYDFLNQYECLNDVKDEAVHGTLLHVFETFITDYRESKKSKVGKELANFNFDHLSSLLAADSDAQDSIIREYLNQDKDFFSAYKNSILSTNHYISSEEMPLLIALSGINSINLIEINALGYEMKPQPITASQELKNAIQNYTSSSKVPWGKDNEVTIYHHNHHFSKEKPTIDHNTTANILTNLKNQPTVKIQISQMDKDIADKEFHASITLILAIVVALATGLPTLMKAITDNKAARGIAEYVAFVVGAIATAITVYLHKALKQEAGNIKTRANITSDMIKKERLISHLMRQNRAHEGLLNRSLVSPDDGSLNLIESEPAALDIESPLLTPPSPNSIHLLMPK